MDVDRLGQTICFGRLSQNRARPSVRSILVGVQVWSGTGAYARAARRRVNLATVLLRLPFGHHPGRRQARHVRIIQIGLRLPIAQANAKPVMPASFR